MISILSKRPLLLLLGFFLGTQFAPALNLSDYGGSGKFSGIFRGITSGKHRLQGSKKNFQGWMMESKTGEKETFALIEFEPSVAEVLSNPSAFIGKECTVTWDMVEELLVGLKEPTDITRIRDVKWTKQGPPSPAASTPAQITQNSLESTIRSFFTAIEYHDIGAVTQMLDDPVQYYQARPISRAAALADIKGDWKRYQDWKGLISDFQFDEPFSCRFKLSYTLKEGTRPRSSTLQCHASVNPAKPGVINKITAKVVKNAPTDLSPKDLPNITRITLDAEESLKNVRLSGKLSATPSTYKGIRLTRITLTLDQPVSVKSPDQEVVDGIKRVAVNAGIAAIEKRLISLVGKNVILEGTLFHMLTPHTEEVYFLDATKILE